VPNEPLLREVLSFIEGHPDQWDPSVWVDGFWGDTCGTVGCLAGWTYLLGTPSPQPQPPAHQVYQQARLLLDLTEDQALLLFGFTAVVGGLGVPRKPTFADLLAKVEAVTGVRFTADAG
jgi:hypothetical protein